MPYYLGRRETCPAGLGRGKHVLGDWLGQVRLAINHRLVKRARVFWWFLYTPNCNL